MPEAWEESQFLFLTWEQLVEDVGTLADAVARESFDAMVAVARGGFVVARILSDFLGVKRVFSIGIEYYRGVGERMRAPSVVGSLGVNVGGQCVLVVDDVADTGETLRVAAEYLRGRGAARVVICTVYVKPWCRLMPDYYAKVVRQWVVFPYEHVETALELLSRGWSYDRLTALGLSEVALRRLRSLGHKSARARAGSTQSFYTSE